MVRETIRDIERWYRNELAKLCRERDAKLLPLIKVCVEELNKRFNGKYIQINDKYWMLCEEIEVGGDSSSIRIKLKHGFYKEYNRIIKLVEYMSFTFSDLKIEETSEDDYVNELINFLK